MNRIAKGLLTMCAAGAITMPAAAQQTSVDGQFSLQGRLTTGTTNEAVVDGQHTLTISLYAEGSNTAIATETDVVTTVDGIFTTMVGDNSTLDLDADMNYEIGITVNGGAELSPRIMIGDAPTAIAADVAATAELALDANAVGGFGVSANGEIGPNQIVTTNAEGRLDASLLDGLIGGNVVTSINGESGAINLNVNGSGVSLDNDGEGNLTLNFTGTGGGGEFTLPFTGTSAAGSGSTAFSLTSTGAGSAATFINTSTGSALNLRSQGSADATLDIESTGGAAIDATGEVTSGAVVEIQNTATGASAELITALNASGDAVFNVGVDGSTMITATAGEALEIVGTEGESRFTVLADGSTTIDATGATALSLTGDADATLSLTNTAEGGASALIEGLNASGSTVFEVAADGQTEINTTAANALDITTSAAGGAAIRLQNTADNVNARLITALDASGDVAFEVMGNGSTTIDVTGDEALNLTSNGATTLMIENTASGNTGVLIQAVDNADNTVFEVGADGQTTIEASVEDALNVATSVTGGTALRVDGGLELPKAAGTGTISAGNLTTTINNALVKPGSIVMLTVNSATNVTNGLRVSSVGNGSFTVSLLDTALGALAGNVSFSYLIINQ